MFVYECCIYSCSFIILYVIMYMYAISIWWRWNSDELDKLHLKWYISIFEGRISFPHYLKRTTFLFLSRTYYMLYLENLNFFYLRVGMLLNQKVVIILHTAHNVQSHTNASTLCITLVALRIYLSLNQRSKS